MQLTADQLAQCDRDGNLFFPSLFSSEETQTLLDAVPALYERREFIPGSARQTSTVPFDDQKAAA
jgi:hypothetical protein